MTAEELFARLLGPFSEHFAARTAQWVRREGAFGTLYAVATAPHDALRADRRHKLLFRSAWVMEKLYFDAPELLLPFAAHFTGTAFPATADASARRHFTKIMAHLLKRYRPDAESWGRIAESAADWMLDPEAKVAVRLGALEVLACCRQQVAWVGESWDDLLEALLRDASPGVASRLGKNGWR